ncbi:hypothetical protein ACVWWQ_002962 [Rhodanobacter sp. TND4EL1]
MSSIWKDLLFLHGHLANKNELDWHADARPEQPGQCKDKETQRSLLACCTHVWPRLTRPR